MKLLKLQSLISISITMLAFTVLSLSMSGCATTSTNQASINPNDAMMMANLYQNQHKNVYLLQAAKIYLNQDNKSAASKALKQINIKQLNATQKQTYNTINIKLLFSEKEYLQVIHNIRANHSQALSSNMLLLLAKSFAGIGNNIEALRNFNLAVDQSPNGAKKDNMIQLWQYLQEVPLTDLQKFARNTALNSDLLSWIHLAILNNSNASTNSFAQAIKQWQQQYPTSPANQLLNSNNIAITHINNQKIALLLPITGPLAANGNAIKNAFFAAYYQYHTHNNQPISIHVYDTNQQNIQDLYQQAQQDNSTLVVGPLTKTNVQTLASLKKLPIPVLALNNINLSKPKLNLYFYGLSPVQDAKQIAQRAWLDNNSPNAIMIIPNNSWGQNIGTAFQQQWQSLGGDILSTSKYSNRQDLYQQVKNSLLLSDSQFRIDSIENTIGKHVRGLTRIRHDVNMIFIVTLPQMARQIVPMLKFYYAQHIPQYAISTIYNGNNNTATDLDLNGLIFNDMPFVLLKHFPSDYPYNDLRNQFATLYPNNFTDNKKLYAFGLDAFLLTHSLNQLQIAPLLGVYGATGQLFLDNQHRIHRRLLWAQMINGSPRLLNH